MIGKLVQGLMSGAGWTFGKKFAEDASEVIRRKIKESQEKKEKEEKEKEQEALEDIEEDDQPEDIE